MNAQTKPTPGPWVSSGKVVNTGAGTCGVRIAVCSIGSACRAGMASQRVDDAQAVTNAAFIAEAGTVAHEVGLTPRQLAEQRKELMGALHKIAYEPIGDAEASAVTVLNECVEIARAALAKAVQP